MGLLTVRQFALKAVRWHLRPFRTSSKLWLSSKAALLGEKNLLLMGAPGAGKTTVGRLLAQRLGVSAIDVDDDVLEVAWQMPVAAKLAAVGGERFLEEEGHALCGFCPTGSVVSLTGSNPLHSGAMQHIKRTGLVVYLDVATGDIMQRLDQMKVDRIVGQEEGVPLGEILSYRKQFYEKWLDVRVLCGTGATVEEIAEKVIRAVERYQNPDAETYVSTRGSCGDGGGPPDGAKKTYFSDVILEGLAPDGGLYVPQNGFPRIDAKEWLRMADMSYPERALAVLERCIHPLDVPAADLRAMVLKAYGNNFAREAVAPVKHLVDNQYVQELFHGPTASFKDLALQLMPQLFAHCLPPACSYLVLVATSGDTGGAVLSGFGGLGDGSGRRIGVLVFFPEDGVSGVQKTQMTARGRGNARAVGVRADFDFCQRAVKRMFGEAAVAGHLAVEYGTVLSTANSINWARLLPQVVYHASAYLDLYRAGVVGFGEPVDVCIPTGNFGNAMSALYAKEMGVPVGTVICASNHNRAAVEFLATGECARRPLAASRSPAIDILRPSNLERLVHRAAGGDGRQVARLFSAPEGLRVPPPLLGRIRREVRAGWCSEEECLDTVRRLHARTGYLADPHTAVASAVAAGLRGAGHRTPPDRPVVVCATAHYGKFAPAVLEALRDQGPGGQDRGPGGQDQGPGGQDRGPGGQDQGPGGRDRGRGGQDQGPGGQDQGPGGRGQGIPLPQQQQQQLPLLEQLRELGRVASAPEPHGRILACLQQGERQPPAVCPADYGLMVEEVERMTQDSFLTAR